MARSPAAATSSARPPTSAPSRPPAGAAASTRAATSTASASPSELLTLVQPFAGKDVAQVLKAILTVEPEPPSRIDPRVPRDLETIVMKTLEKDPASRYQSADELADDLRRFLNFEAISARPVPRRTRLLRAMRRHKSGLALSALG